MDKYLKRLNELRLARGLSQIAAHFGDNEYTDEEPKRYAEFIKSKRN